MKGVILLLSVLLTANVACADGPINIPDAALKAAIENALGISDPNATEMLGLYSLSAENYGISNLTGLEYATNLTKLWLFHNQISDISAVSGLTNLTELWLGWNNVSDISVLSSLTNLTKLGIWDNLIADVSLSGLQNLTFLNLDGNVINNIWLSNLPNLDILRFEGNEGISDISWVSGLSNLQELALSGTKISDLSAIDNLTNLTHLYASDCNVSDISALSGLTNLTELNLEENPLNCLAYCRDLPIIVKNNPGIKLYCDPYFLEVDRISQGGGWGFLGESRCGPEISLSDSCITDYVNCPPPEPNHNQCTIKSKGCVLTSATMIYNYFLYPNLNPNQLNDEPLMTINWGEVPSGVFYNRQPSSTDPNYRLKTNGLYWPYVSHLMCVEAESIFRHEPIKSGSLNSGSFEEKIIQIICEQEVPVAVKLRGHTVVAYGFEFEDPNVLRILIRDPGDGTRTYLEHAVNVYTSIEQLDYIYPRTRPVHYGSINYLAELVIYDSSGRRTGHDPRTSETYGEIPGVVYWVEWPIADVNDPCSQPILERSQLRKTAYIDVPPGEVLNFEVIGTDDGQGHFVLESMGATGEIKVLVQQLVELEPNSIESIYVELPGPGDFDLDGDVDSVDFGVFINEWLQTGDGLAADIYPVASDGVVNLLDFAIFANNWLSGL